MQKNRALTLLSTLTMLSACGGSSFNEQEGEIVSSASTAPVEAVTLIREQEVGRSGAFYMDPEFHARTFQVAFYLGEKLTDCNQVYLGQLDPDTGFFVSHEYQHIDRAAPIYATLNGPEFGESREGVAVYYTGIDENHRFHTFRFRDGQTTQLDQGNDFVVANYASNNASDPAALVFGARYSPRLLVGVRRPWTIFSEDRPNEQQTFYSASIGKGPRFIPGRRQVTTNMADHRGRHQIALYDFDQDSTTRLTWDADDKESAVMFAAPELGGEMLLFAQVNVVNGGGDAIRIYRESYGKWKRYRQLDAPVGATYQNVQAVSYKGRSFFTVNRKHEGSYNNDILLLSMDGQLELVVSGSASMKRFDPETVLSGEHLFIYYYDLATGRLYMSDLVL